MSATTLKRSWNKLWPDPNDAQPSEPNENDIITSEILVASSAALDLADNDVHEWLRCDDADAGHRILTDQEIIQQVNEVDAVSDTDYDGSKGVDLRTAAKDAASHMQHFIEWYEQQPEASGAQTILLRKFRKLATDKSVVEMKQITITEHFTKEN